MAPGCRRQLLPQLGRRPSDRRDGDRRGSRHWDGDHDDGPRDHRRYGHRRHKDNTGKYIAIGLGALMLGIIASEAGRH